MSKISFKQVYDNLSRVATSYNEFSFLEEFLNAFGCKRSISSAVVRTKDELFARKSLHIKRVPTDDLHFSLDAEISRLSLAMRTQKQHLFSAFTDMNTLVAYNLETEDTITVELRYLASATEFFLPLAKISQPVIPKTYTNEYSVIQSVAKLYDVIRVDNPLAKKTELSLFICRIIFCLYAEDLGLFDNNLLLTEIENSQEDGSDLGSILKVLFLTLDLHPDSRPVNRYSNLPYVNGGLFNSNPFSPVISEQLRRDIIGLFELDWKQLNPRVFGNMFPLIMKIEDRLDFSKLIESQDSINRIINPMVIEELRSELIRIKELDLSDDAVESRLKSYERLLTRLSKIQVVDLNCGSSILPTAYNDLREIEFDILAEIKSHGGSTYINGYRSLIDLNNFCGVQDDAVVHQMAKLSMWLTDFSVNIKFNRELGIPYHFFPVQTLPNIVNDDAMAMSSWEQFSDKNLETYIICNLMNEHIDDVFDWIQRGADEISGRHMEFTFAATDTVCQGNSVNTMWLDALGGEVEIRFACQSFNWDGMRNAVVVCLSEDYSKDKLIISSEGTHKVSAINAYLFESNTVGVKTEQTPQFSLPPLVEGCKSDCSYNMTLSLDERNVLIEKHPEAHKYIKQYLTSKNLYGEDIEYCVLMKNIADTKSGIGMRLILHNEIGQSEIKQFVNNPNYQNAPSIVIPKNFSTDFNHIPIIAVGSETVSHASNYVLYNPERWMFALLSSRMHQEWVKNVGTQSDKFTCYSHERCYNTFPVPELTDGHKSTLGKFANNIIRARAVSVQSLDIMYHPETMHCELKQAHAELDDYIDNLYLRVTDRKRRITANLDRVSILFNMISMHQEGKKLRAQEAFAQVAQELTEIEQLLRV